MTPLAVAPYLPVVTSILAASQAREVLDAPCGSGVLGRTLNGTGLALDGTGLWEFPQADGGYRRVWEHDLDRPLALEQTYDAIVCAEAIHLLTNPGVLLESCFQALRPGGTLIVTTPNTWYLRSRVQYLLRGFHSGFRPMIGRCRGQDYITYIPWTFTQLHLLLTRYGFGDVLLHDVDEPKPKRWIEHVLAWSSIRYCRRQQRQAADSSVIDYWRQASSPQAMHGRWLVVSACRPANVTHGVV